MTDGPGPFKELKYLRQRLKPMLQDAPSTQTFVENKNVSSTHRVTEDNNNNDDDKNAERQHQTSGYIFIHKAVTNIIYDPLKTYDVNALTG